MPPRKRAAEAEDPQEVFARELQAEAKRRGCAVFVLEEPESDEPSLEELWALKKIFAPKEAAKEMGKISEELGMIGRDGPDDWLRMTDTSSSWDAFPILQNHLKRLAVKVKGKKWKPALALALGLTMAAKEESFCFCDTDGPEEVEKIWTIGRDGPNDCFRMTNTSSSWEAFPILQSHLKRLAVKVKGKKWKQALALALALGLTMAAKEEDFWFGDTDGPEEVEEIWTSLGKSWTAILDQDDDTLGLGDDDRDTIDELWEGLRPAIESAGIDLPDDDQEEEDDDQ